MTPLGMIASLFYLWRGDLEVTIKISKTQYHSGRLQVAFNPISKGASGSTVNITNTGWFLNRIVWDVRESSELKFTIPFTYISPWLRCQDSMGNLNVRVLNPLRCPETVSTTVDLAVELRACDNFEVAMPARHYLTPYIPLTTQSGLEKIVSIASKVRKIDAISPCIGEKVEDFRDLLKRYSAYDLVSAGADDMDQFQYQSSQLNTSYWSGGTLVLVTYKCTLDAIVCAFTGFRGSIGYRFLANNIYSIGSGQTAAAAAYAQVHPVNNLTLPGWASLATKAQVIGSETESSYLANSTGAALAFSRIDINSGPEIQVPHYHYDPYKATMNLITDGNSNFGFLGADQVLVEYNTFNLFSPTHVFRRGGDDFSLYEFISFGAYNIT